MKEQAPAQEKLNEREILRQQMDLLVLRSKSCKDKELPALTLAMVEIYKSLYWKPLSTKGT